MDAAGKHEAGDAFRIREVGTHTLDGSLCRCAAFALWVPYRWPKTPREIASIARAIGRVNANAPVSYYPFGVLN